MFAVPLLAGCAPHHRSLSSRMHDSPEAAARLRHAQIFTLIAAFLGWMFDGLEMGIFPLVANPALQEMNGGVFDKAFNDTWMGYITCTFLLGAAAGGLIFGWLGDRIGRVRAMILSVLAYSIFTGLNYFAHTPWQLALFRFISALGMGGEWSLGVALVMEAWPRDKRPLMAGVIGAAANVGYALIALLSIRFHITTDSWRWVMLVGAAPALLALIISHHVPESERWKESVEKEGKAANPLRTVFSGALLKNTLLAISFASVALIATWCSVQWFPLWMREMPGGIDHPEWKGTVQLASSIGAIIGCLIAPAIGALLGRRVAYFLLCLGSIIACNVIFRVFHEYSTMFVITAGVVGAFSASFYGWLPLYLPELFPTRVRATGQGVAFNSGRILAAVVALNTGTINHYFGSYAKAGIWIVSVYLIGMVLIWFAPETKDRPLPE
jgi:MFS family permease